MTAIRSDVVTIRVGMTAIRAGAWLLPAMLVLSCLACSAETDDPSDADAETTGSADGAVADTVGAGDAGDAGFSADSLVQSDGGDAASAADTVVTLDPATATKMSELTYATPDPWASPLEDFFKAATAKRSGQPFTTAIHDLMPYEASIFVSSMTVDQAVSRTPGFDAGEGGWR